MVPPDDDGLARWPDVALIEQLVTGHVQDVAAELHALGDLDDNDVRALLFNLCDWLSTVVCQAVSATAAEWSSGDGT